MDFSTCFQLTIPVDKLAHLSDKLNSCTLLQCNKIIKVFSNLNVSEKDESAVISTSANNLKCPPNGVMDLGPCKFGAPLFLSWPLFYLANQSLSQAIDGLQQPNEEDHGFRMDIQPTMGLGISVRVRMQMNLKIESSPVLTGLPNSLKGSDFLLPIMWFDDAIEEPPRTILSMLQVALRSGQGD